MEISIVIPVYNRAHLINKALESLVTQTYNDFDVIIVDDGSSDNIQEIVYQYKKQLKIRFVSFPHSGNIAFLRNEGLKISDSRYVAILDSDDWCMDNRLEKQVKYMKQHPECDILATWVSLEDDFQNENTNRLYWLYNMINDRSEIIKRCLNDGCCICNSTVLMKKDRIIELGGYDEEMYICEDFNLWIRALIENYNIDILQEKLIVRKLHKESVTSGYNGSNLSIQLVIRNKIKYLKMTNKLKRKIVIWGVNARNDLLFKELERNNVSEVQVIDIYNEMPIDIDVNAYHLITTFSRRDEIFEYLNCHNLNVVEDYIYT